MKNIFFKLWLLICLFMFLVSNTNAYDQSFPTVKLRYWYQYKFYDIFNAGSNQVWINEVITTFKENDWNINGWVNPSFPWYIDLISKGYIINSNQSVKSVESDIYYQILYHPLQRKTNNLEIIYDTSYYKNVSWNWEWPIHHTEYQPYEITWCGDGILDNYIDQYTWTSISETCDPNDASKTGWGAWGCNVTNCQPINIVTTPVCNNLSINPLIWASPLNSNVSCSWTNATTYTINCWNGQTINASTWVCSYATVWTYTPTCYVDGTITSTSCQQTISVTNTTSSSSSSSGGWDYQCRNISMSGNQITCTWNHLVKTFRLNCSWTYQFLPSVIWTSSTTSATFTCSDTSASCSVYNQEVTESSFYSWLTNPACNLTPSSSSSSWGSSSSGWSSPDYCWDWVVQRPNDNFELEECDFGTWTWPAWCSPATCKINWVVSFPNDGEIVFWPSDNVIVWNNMNPYSEYSLWKPSILNKSGYDLYFDSLCVVKKSWTTISWWTTCEPIWKTLYPWMSYSFANYPNFVWNTSTLTSGTYWDNVLVTTIENKWNLYTNAYFASELKVRVSKPSITTTWWGTSFLNNTTNVANISNVTQITWNSDINKNFVWAWVSIGDISSYSTDVTNVSSVNTVSQDWDNYNNAVNENTTITGLSVWTTNSITDFE